VVYLAKGDDEERVAIKVIRDDWASDGQFRERLTREAESARKVAAFCIARVLDADLSGEFPYIVSEYVAGPSLQEDVRARGPRPATALYRLAVYTATALMAIHDAGIVHRDFKPGNVLLGPDGPRVIDFGIARALEGGDATITHGLIGTPSYMPPEQFRSEPVGPPADVFAWACVIVYAATGKPPFGDDRVPAVMRRILYDSPEIGDLESRLRSLIVQCLAKDPARRPTARAILLRLVGRDDHRSGGLQSARQLIEAARDTFEDPPAR
jgi:serine/threonine protein kinase